MTLGRCIKRKWLRLCARVMREKKSPEYVARGWAIGMFYGCTIPFGLQLILSIPTAFILKGSKIGATIGTFITNHFTIFFLYPAQCYAGSLLLGGNLTYSAIEKAMADVIEKQSFSSLSAVGGELVASFFIGGALLALVCTPLTYFGVLRAVKSRRAKKMNRASAKAS